MTRQSEPGLNRRCLQADGLAVESGNHRDYYGLCRGYRDYSGNHDLGCRAYGYSGVLHG